MISMANWGFVLYVSLGKSRVCGLYTLPEEGEGEAIQHPIGIHRDDSVLSFAEIANVLTGDIVRGLSFFLISCLVDTEGKCPPCECLFEQLEPLLP